MSDLQNITDSLARRIQRSVTIDDSEMRLLTHSSQPGAIDDGRLASILRRRTPENVVHWINSLGIATSTCSMRVPANTALGTLARFCVPIRCNGNLLGYLWVLDPDSTLDDDDLAMAESSATMAGKVLYRELLLIESDDERERELVHKLLSEQSDLRQSAADELTREGLYTRGGVVCVLVARPVLNSTSDWDEDLELALSQILQQASRSRFSWKYLKLVRSDQAILVVTADERVGVADEIQKLGQWLRVMLTERLADARLRSLLVGIGGTYNSLLDVVSSYREAYQAIHVAEMVGGFGPIVTWAQLGVYQLLSQYPLERLTLNQLHPGLVKLFHHPDGKWLVETLEHYLDNGGDVKMTAVQLTLRRSSLYYRLQRIQQIAEVDLSRGDERLTLHLGLKLVRLAGISPFWTRDSKS